MIVGVGIDVVDIARFERALDRTQGLASRLFTDSERGLPVRSLAARFAAKEALAKALGAPRGLLWTDAEVVTGPLGRPELRVDGTVAAAAARLGVRRWHVSVSHDGGVATAVVIAEGAAGAEAATDADGARGGAGSAGGAGGAATGLGWV
jgi:holo-[acyl-carrier protein] synthase